MGMRRKRSRIFVAGLLVLGMLVDIMNVQAATVKLSKTSLELEVGQTAVLKLKNVKKNIEVKWKTSNSSIAKVSTKGKITAITEGTVKIVAFYNKKKYICRVTVKNKDIPQNIPTTEVSTEDLYDYKIIYDKVIITKIKRLVDTDVVIPDMIEGYPVTKLGTAIFQDCDGLNSVKLPSGITEIPEQAFWGCESLTKVIFDGKIDSIGQNAFYNCVNLQQLDGDWSRVTLISDGCFKNCINMELQSLPSELLEIGNEAFYNCDNLGISVILPKKMVKIGDRAFWDCDGLFSVILMTDEKQQAVLESIGAYAFADCDKLANISTSKAAKMKNYGEGCFSDCAKLLSADLGGSAAKYGPGIFSGCKALSKVNLAYGITSIPVRAFYECYNLTEITLPASVTRIESQAFSYAFLESGARWDIRFMVCGEKMESAQDAFSWATTNRVKVYYLKDDIGIWGQNMGFQCIKL